MGWFKKDVLPEATVKGGEVYVNQYPLAAQHLDRTIQRIQRIKISMKDLPPTSERYLSFKNELNRLEIALLEYEQRQKRGNS